MSNRVLMVGATLLTLVAALVWIVNLSTIRADGTLWEKYGLPASFVVMAVAIVAERRLLAVGSASVTAFILCVAAFSLVVSLSGYIRF